MQRGDLPERLRVAEMRGHQVVVVGAVDEPAKTASDVCLNLCWRLPEFGHQGVAGDGEREDVLEIATGKRIALAPVATCGPLEGEKARGARVPNREARFDLRCDRRLEGEQVPSIARATEMVADGDEGEVD